MMMTCDDTRMSLGAYVLGALEPEECVLVEAHLAECDGCRAEFEELTGVAGFLGKVSEEDVAHVASPPHAVLERLLGARARRRRMTRVLLSLAASVLVVGLGGTMWAAMRPSSENDGSTALSVPVSTPDVSQYGYAPEGSGEARDLREKKPAAPSASSSQAPPEAQIFRVPPGQERTVRSRAGSVQATVVMTEGEGATTLKVVLSGVARGTPCRLDVIGASGERQTAGNWVVNRAAYDKSGAFLGTTTIPFGSITRFEITSAQGHVLVNVPVR